MTRNLLLKRVAKRPSNSSWNRYILFSLFLSFNNFMIIILVSNYTVPCAELPRDIPGSNLYYGAWICLLSSIDISLKWKAAQALRFASQSQTHAAAQETTTTTGVQQPAGQ